MKFKLLNIILLFLKIKNQTSITFFYFLENGILTINKIGNMFKVDKIYLNKNLDLFQVISKQIKVI